MAKLSAPMGKALTRIAHLEDLDGAPAMPLHEDGKPIRPGTLDALLSRSLVEADGTRGYRITQAGRDALAEAGVARTLPVQNGTVDLPTGAVEPEVPKAWVDQLVALLEAGAGIRKTDRGWRVWSRPGRTVGNLFAYQWERLDAAAREAIRLGIAVERPPTATGIVSLALKD